MEVKNTNNAQNGMFFIEENGNQLAFMSYTFLGSEKFTIDHTVVNPGNEGKGLGKQLVQAAVDYARARHLKILPLCPYAKSVFDKTEAYNDVLLKE